MLIFNNEKWDFWALAISAIITQSFRPLGEQLTLIVDSRALTLLNAFQLLRERYDQPVPLELLEGISPSDIAILVLITNEYYGKTALTYSKDGLQLSKEVAG